MASSVFPTVTTGVTVETATNGALSGDGSSGNKLAVGVDGTTIDVNGSNQLAVIAGFDVTADYTLTGSWAFSPDTAGGKGPTTFNGGEGQELVTDDFTLGTGWTEGPALTFTHDPAETANLTNAHIVLTPGSGYYVIVTVTPGMTAAGTSANLTIGGVTVPVLDTDTDDETEIFALTTDSLSFEGVSGWDAAIAFSLKPIVDAGDANYPLRVLLPGDSDSTHTDYFALFGFDGEFGSNWTPANGVPYRYQFGKNYFMFYRPDVGIRYAMDHSAFSVESEVDGKDAVNIVSTTTDANTSSAYYSARVHTDETSQDWSFGTSGGNVAIPDKHYFLFDVTNSVLALDIDPNSGDPIWYLTGLLSAPLATAGDGHAFTIAASAGFDDGMMTPQNGGDLNLNVGAGVNGGTAGIIQQNGSPTFSGTFAGLTQTATVLNGLVMSVA